MSTISSPALCECNLCKISISSIHKRGNESWKCISQKVRELWIWNSTDVRSQVCACWLFYKSCEHSSSSQLSHKLQFVLSNNEWTWRHAASDSILPSPSSVCLMRPDVRVKWKSNCFLIWKESLSSPRRTGDASSSSWMFESWWHEALSCGKEVEGCSSVTCMSIEPEVSREEPCQSFLGGDSCCGGLWKATGFYGDSSECDSLMRLWVFFVSSSRLKRLPGNRKL